MRNSERANSISDAKPFPPECRPKHRRQFATNMGTFDYRGNIGSANLAAVRDSMLTAWDFPL
jgi:hypothetical protein